MKKIITILIYLIISQSLVHAQNLSDSDKNSLIKQKNIEHILYETYLESDKGPISVIGYHFDSYINDNYYFILAIFGAIEGERGGYGIAAVGLGYSYELTENIIFDSKFMTGSGGGGGVPAGGGFSLEYQAGLSYQFAKNFFIDAKYGYLEFPNGTFKSPITNIGLSYRYYTVNLPF